MGRPLAPIDAEQVYKLARLGCTQRDIGEFFGVDEKTIRNRFSAEFRQGHEQGKISLRRLQWKRAFAGSDTILVHLGKNMLGQSEKIQAEVSAGEPIYECSPEAEVLPPAETEDLLPDQG